MVIKTSHPWYRPRHYLHFDPPIGLKHAERVVTNPQRVGRYAFFPFIGYEVVTEKIKHNRESGQLTKTEKSRPIAYAAHLDSHIYAYYAFLLSEKYECAVCAHGLHNSVLAFRALGKSNIEFANEAFTEIQERGECSAIALDISGFFDNLDHQILKASWAAVLGHQRLPNDHFAVFESLTRFSKVDRERVYAQFGVAKNNPKYGRRRLCAASEFRVRIRDAGLIWTNPEKRGIPQGSPISALLSNIYMLNFDRACESFMAGVGGRYLRYCDDMLFIVPHGQETCTHNFVCTEIGNMELKINEKKTEIRTFNVTENGLYSEKPLQYLGFVFDGQRKLIRSSAFARFSDRMKRGVRLAKLTKIKRDEQRKARGEHPRNVFRRKLYERYSHLGKRNFVRYGLRAADIMKSPAIKRQLKPLWFRLKQEIEKK